MRRLSGLLLLLGAVSGLAQQGATAELTGTVSAAGHPLPGVMVTLAADALQGKRITITGENGGYLFPLLPPGDYLLRFDGQGLASAEKHARVSLAATARVDVELLPAPLRETVVVESDRARSADASIGMNVRALDLQRLPGGRDIRAAIILSSSVDGQRTRLLVAGAPSWDSIFLVDGVVVNEYLTGQPHNLYVEDAIEELVLLTGGISTEYGRFTGGMVSALTKSGGNQFTGSVRDAMTNGAWTRRTPWPNTPDPLDKINRAVEGTAGGFVIKDRLWFFAAMRTAEASVRSFTALTNIAYRSDSRDSRRDVKLTQQIASRHSLIASYVDDSLKEANAVDSRRVLDLASLTPKRWQPARLLALTYEGLLAPNTFAEIHDSRKSYALRGNGGRSGDRILGTLIVDRADSANLNAPFGCGICGDDARNSDSWVAKAALYGNTHWGDHSAVVGAEGFQEQRFNDASRSASEFNIQAPSAAIVGGNAYPTFLANPQTLIDWTSPIARSRGTDQKTRSAFVNDRWDVTSRASVDVGLRYDRNDVTDALGRSISNHGALSPRLGATFDLRNDGRHRLSASLGRYTAKILEGGGAPQQVGVFSELGWRYSGTEIKLLPSPDALAKLFAWFDSIGGIQNRDRLQFISDPRYTEEFPRTLKSPVVDQWSVGYAMQLQRGAARVDYIARKWHHFYAGRVDTTTGQRFDPLVGRLLDVAWVVNDDSETVRSYRAVQMQGSWRFRRISAGGAYTWSKLRGNDDEEDGGNGAPRNLPLALWYPELLGYPQRRPIGYLRQDQRHRARIWFGGEKALPSGVLSAWMLQWFDSGRAYSAVANIAPDVQGLPAYAFNQVKQGSYFFSNRGAFRTDNVLSTDLAVTYEIPYRNARLFLKGDVLNLFDNAAVVAPVTVVTTATQGSANLRPFNPFTVTPVEGVHYLLSSDFGKPNGPGSYQTPRTVQLSVGAHFGSR